MMKIINNHRPLTLMGKHLGRIDGVRWDGVSLIKGPASIPFAYINGRASYDIET